MRDVAEFAGVALTTVSRAFSDPDKLSPDTLRRIQSASAELGYTINFSARSLRRKSSGMLLVLLPDIGNTFFSLVLKGIESAAREGGRVLLIGDTGSDASLADACAGQLDAGAVDGMILLDGRLPFAPGSRGRERLLGSPVVALSERIDGDPVPFVGIDNARAGRDVAHLLADLGHIAVAHVAGPSGNSLTAERRRGFLLGARERGLSVTGSGSGRLVDRFGRQGRDPAPGAPRSPERDLRRQRRDGHRRHRGRGRGRPLGAGKPVGRRLRRHRLRGLPRSGPDDGAPARASRWAAPRSPAWRSGSRPCRVCRSRSSSITT